MRIKHHKIIISVLSIIIFGASYYFYQENFVQRSLYHYIRRGNEQMKEGKLRQAFLNYEKAYAARPQTEELLQKIFYGYVRYAEYLAGKNEFDKAIEIIYEIHEENPEEHALTYKLCLVQIKKSVWLVQTGEFEEAADLMADSVSRALIVNSDNLRLTLANYLFSQAAIAFEANEHELVPFLLESSYNIWSRYETVRFLGYYHYSRNEMERSRFWWEKAYLLQPDNREAQHQLSVLDKKSSLEKDMRSIETDYFDISLYGDYEIDEDVLVEIMREVSEVIGEEFNFYPPERTQIVFYSKEDFREVFDVQGTVRAFYDGAIRLHLGELSDMGNLKALIAHEYTHAVVSMIAGANCPIWLHEGLAVYQQSRYEVVPVSTLDSYFMKGKSLSIQEIENNFNDQNDPYKKSLSYQASYSIVDFMIEKWGFSALMELLKNIGDGVHYVNAIERQYYVTLPVFEKMWMESIGVGP